VFRVRGEEKTFSLLTIPPDLSKKREGKGEGRGREREKEL